jgi:hypothetical protein
MFTVYYLVVWLTMPDGPEWVREEHEYYSEGEVREAAFANGLDLRLQDTEGPGGWKIEEEVV